MKLTKELENYYIRMATIMVNSIKANLKSYDRRYKNKIVFDLDVGYAPDFTEFRWAFFCKYRLLAIPQHKIKQKKVTMLYGDMLNKSIQRVDTILMENISPENREIACREIKNLINLELKNTPMLH